MSLPGCATRPGDLAEALAAAQGLTRLVVTGEGFRHLAYARGGVGAGEGGDGRIHLYLEGDGRPWASRHRVAPDPTPLNPFALRLMGRDPASVLYVGRPCYHGFAEDPGCGPWLWTQGRYSPAVVASMVAAIEALVPTREGLRITLIGYSGGGVLALLIASRLDAVDQVITVAANLDVEAWAEHHAYSPLAGSLNPSVLAPLPARVHQLHLAGARDRQVPPATVASFMVRNPTASFRVIKGFDHRCCWIEQWPEILALMPMGAASAATLVGAASASGPVSRKPACGARRPSSKAPVLSAGQSPHAAPSGACRMYKARAMCPTVIRDGAWACLPSPGTGFQSVPDTMIPREASHAVSSRQSTDSTLGWARIRPMARC